MAATERVNIRELIKEQKQSEKDELRFKKYVEKEISRIERSKTIDKLDRSQKEKFLVNFQKSLMASSKTFKALEGEKAKKVVDEMLGNTKKQSKMLKVSKAFWENHAIREFKNHLGKVVSDIGGHIREVLGPIADVIDTIKNGLLGIYSFVKGTITSAYQALTGGTKEEKLNKERNGLLKSILNYFKKEEKRIARTPKEKKKMGLTRIIVGIGALLLGLTIGYIKKFKEAFQPFLNMFKFLGSKFKKTGGKFSTFFSKVFGKTGYISKSISKFLKIVDNMGFAKKLFKFGKFFGSILLTLEMLIKVWKGILDPILAIPEMLGNGILFILRKFIGEDFLKGFKFDFSASAIVKFVNSITKWVGEQIQSFISLVNTVAGWFKKDNKKEPSAVRGKISDILEKPENTSKEKITDFESAKRAAKQRTKAEAKIEKEQEKKQRENLIKEEKKNREINNKLMINQINSSKTEGSEAQQIPEDTDNYLLSLAASGLL
jgi:hypothetical protein